MGIEARAAEGSALAGISALGLPVIILVGSWLVGRVVTALKQRITYPRTGYVAYRRPTGHRRVLTAVLAAGIALLLVIAIGFTAPESTSWIPAMDGLAIGAFMLYLAYTLGLPRFYVLTLAAVLAGVGTSLTTPDETLGSAIFFGAMGAAIALSGALTLRHYLRQTAPSDGRAPATGGLS